MSERVKDVGKEIRSLLGGLDGLILIYPHEEIEGFWNPNHPIAEKVYALFTQAKQMGVPVFLNRNRGNIVPDPVWIHKLELIGEAKHIQEFDFPPLAAAVLREINKLPENITLGFGGGLSNACVHGNMVGLCRITETTQTINSPVPPNRKPLEHQFGRGKLITELTEDAKHGIFRV